MESAGTRFVSGHDQLLSALAAEGHFEVTCQLSPFNFAAITPKIDLDNQ